MKKLLVIGIIIFGIGFITTIIFGIVSYGEADVFGEEEYTYQELEYDSDQFTSIKIDMDNKRIITTPSDSGKIEIKFYVSTHENLTISDSSTTLTITCHTKWFYGFSCASSCVNFVTGNTDYNRLYLYVPDSVAYRLNLESSNGSISTSDLNLSELEIDSSNGSIEVNDVSADEISVTTSNGSIDISNCIATEGSTLGTSNGSINVDSFTTPNLDARSSNGSIEINLNGNKDDYDIDLTTSLGSLYLDGVKLGDKTYDTHNNKDNEVVARTSNGSIRLNFSE